MKWFTKFFAIDAESVWGKLLLLVVDKLLIGAIIALAFIVYDRYRISDQQRFEAHMADHIHSLEQERRNQEAAREERAAKVQHEFERARLAKELLPLILDETSNVVARGYVLSSALSAGLIDPEATIEVALTLHDQGIPDGHIRRIANVALPAGLGAIARHGAHLRDESRRHGEPNLTPQLQAVQKERLLWAAALREAMPHVGEPEEGKIVTRSFLTRHLSSLYFLLEPGAADGLFRSSSRTLRLIGALDCVIQNLRLTPEAANHIGAELASLDLTSNEDLAYALALVDVLREYGRGSTAQYARIAPEIAIHLARLLVDGSFLHHLPWIADDAPPAQRKQWLSEETAANAHSSLQYRAGEVLWLMGSRAYNAEGVLISFIDRLVRDIDGTKTGRDVSLLRSRYGKHSARFAVAVLVSIDTKASNVAIQKLKELGEDKLVPFEGIRMELGPLE